MDPISSSSSSIAVTTAVKTSGSQEKHDAKTAAAASGALQASKDVTVSKELKKQPKEKEKQEEKTAAVANGALQPSKDKDAKEKPKEKEKQEEKTAAAASGALQPSRDKKFKNHSKEKEKASSEGDSALVISSNGKQVIDPNLEKKQELINRISKGKEKVAQSKQRGEKAQEKVSSLDGRVTQVLSDQQNVNEDLVKLAEKFEKHFRAFEKLETSFETTKKEAEKSAKEIKEMNEEMRIYREGVQALLDQLQKFENYATNTQDVLGSYGDLNDWYTQYEAHNATIKNWESWLQVAKNVSTYGTAACAGGQYVTGNTNLLNFTFMGGCLVFISNNVHHVWEPKSVKLARAWLKINGANKPKLGSSPSVPSQQNQDPKIDALIALIESKKKPNANTKHK